MRAYRFGFVAMALVMAAPANAEVQKFMFHCEGRQQLCPFFRPLVEIPDGWVEDKEATRHFGAVILVPKGIAFDDAEARSRAERARAVAFLTKPFSGRLLLDSVKHALWRRGLH